MEPNFLSFAIALLIGALVGVDREKRRIDTAEPSFAGLRTFILLAEAGAISAWLSRQLNSPWVFIGLSACIAAAVLVGYVVQTRLNTASTGMTTEVAAIIVFLLGGVVVLGHASLAVALGIATSGLLAFKEPLHAAITRIGRDDIYAALKLLIAAFIVLPVLPNRTIDPWNALNPYKMWWLVILISGLSLAGYVATRWLGPGQGIPLTGIVGGIVSSTAVSLTFARRSKADDFPHASAMPLAAGILFSWTVSFARILIATLVLSPPLANSLLAPIISMAGASLIIGLVLLLRARSAPTPAPTDVPLKNPFSLRAAIRFAALLTLVMVVVKLVGKHASAAGVYAVAAIAGLTDVDAITLSMSQSAKEGAPLHTAAIAITIAAVANTLSKCSLVVALGSQSLRPTLVIATCLILAVGAFSFLL